MNLQFHKGRRHVKEIPLAPVLDLLTVVVFFLILSASFVELRKTELPQTEIVTKNDSKIQDNKKPKSPKILLENLADGKMHIILKWSGDTPGKVDEKIVYRDGEYSAEIKVATTKIAAEFLKTNPDEKSIQVGFSSNISYQTVLSCLDGLTIATQDIALVSPQDTEKFIKENL